MTDKKRKISAPKAKKEGMLPEMMVMLKASLGRLPTSLVMIFVVAVIVAILSGFILKFAEPVSTTREFLPVRLDAHKELSPTQIKRLQGNWIIRTPEYISTFTIDGEKFEWIVSFGDIQGIQYYARGNYKLVGDVMILGMRTDLGIPYDTRYPWMKFMPMAMRNLNFYVTTDGRQLQWIIPDGERKNIISHAARILSGMTGDTVLLWERL